MEKFFKWGTIFILILVGVVIFIDHLTPNPVSQASLDCYQTYGKMMINSVPAHCFKYFLK